MEVGRALFIYFSVLLSRWCDGAGGGGVYGSVSTGEYHTSPALPIDQSEKSRLHTRAHGVREISNHIYYLGLDEIIHG